MKTHPRLIVLSTIACLLTIIVASWLILVIKVPHSPKKTSPISNKIVPTSTPQPTPAPFLTGSDWTIYENSDLGYLVSIPPNTQVTPSYATDIFSNSQNNWRIDVTNSTIYPDLDSYRFLGTSPTQKVTINSQPGLFFVFPFGYCDGPQCSAPFVTYAFFKNKYFYNLTFYNNTSMDSTEWKIINSFNFLKPTPQP